MDVRAGAAQRYSELGTARGVRVAEWDRCGIRRRQCTSGRFQTGVWPPESISSGCPAIFGRTDTGILLLRLARRVSSPGSLSCERLHCCPTVRPQDMTVKVLLDDLQH